MLTIEIKFNKPVNGWWDGGARCGGTFIADPTHRYSAESTCFGSYELNTWFNVKTGRTAKETLGRAKRWLKNNCRQPFTFGVVEEN